MTPFPRRCETCAEFTWDGSGDGGACHLRAVRTPTPVRPEMKCPHWVANTTILTAEVHRLKSQHAGVQRLALAMADRIEKQAVLLGRKAEWKPLPIPDLTGGGGI